MRPWYFERYGALPNEKFLLIVKLIISSLSFLFSVRCLQLCHCAFA
jgi:hypothetical protein